MLSRTASTQPRARSLVKSSWRAACESYDGWVREAALDRHGVEALFHVVRAADCDDSLLPADLPLDDRRRRKQAEGALPPPACAASFAAARNYERGSIGALRRRPHATKAPSAARKKLDGCSPPRPAECER